MTSASDSDWKPLDGFYMTDGELREMIEKIDKPSQDSIGVTWGDAKAAAMMALQARAGLKAAQADALRQAADMLGSNATPSGIVEECCKWLRGRADVIERGE